MGFVVIPYEPCVSNEMVNRKQFTLLYHKVNLKLSHVYTMGVTKSIKILEGIYCNMRATQANKSDYLGMYLDFITEREFKFIVINYLKGVM